MNLDMNVTNYLKVCNQHNMSGRRTKQCIPSARRALHDLRVEQTKGTKLTRTSASFLAETSVTSPRILFTFII